MKKLFVAGHKVIVGNAVCKKLQDEPDVKLITRSSKQLDLSDQIAVKEFIKSKK